MPHNDPLLVIGALHFLQFADNQPVEINLFFQVIILQHILLKAVPFRPFHLIFEKTAYRPYPSIIQVNYSSHDFSVNARISSGIASDPA